MNALQNNLARNILVTVLLLAALALVGTVGQSRAEPLLAGPAAGPDVALAAESFFDIFVEIEGIEGESTAPGHRGSIEVQSWSWGVSQMATGGGGGGGGAVGRELKGHVTLIKRIDKASPLLCKRCVDGTPLPLVIVQLTRADGQTYLKYELKNVMVSSIVHGGDLDGDGAPDETLELTFDGAKLTYTQFDATGKPVGQSSAQW